MNKVSVTFIFGVLAVIVVATEGSLDKSAIWNLAPLLLSYSILLFIAPRKGRKWKDIPRQRVVPSMGFCAGATGLTTLGHLAWFFDWGHIASGSSTAGLMLGATTIPAGLFFLAYFCLVFFDLKIPLFSD